MTHEPMDDVLKALRDELAGVAPSPEFASQVRERVAGEWPLLRDELAAVTPSPEFKVRVRQQIEAAGAPRRAGWLSGWRWLAPVGMAAAVILVIVLSRRGGETPAPVTSVADRGSAPVTAPPADGVATAPQRPASVAARAGSRATARTSNVEVRTSPVKPAEGPSLEVITNQPAILRALSAQIAAGAQMVETTTTPLPETAPEMVVPTLEVSPLVVKPLGEPPVIGGGSSVIR